MREGYLFKCGHLNKERIRVKSKDNNYSTLWCCPVCWDLFKEIKPIVNNVYPCRCGVRSVVSNKYGAKNSLCPVCKKEYKQEKKKKKRGAQVKILKEAHIQTIQQQLKAIDKIPGEKMPERKRNCLHYLEKCMLPPRGRLLTNPKACLNCKEFIDQGFEN